MLMTFSCKWCGKNCSARDFEDITTDHGVCFTFNNNLLNQFSVSQTGKFYFVILYVNR